MAPPQTYEPKLQVVDEKITKFRANDLSAPKTDRWRAEYEKNYKPPNFTIKELRDCIPPHLFKRSAIKSSMYVVYDLVLISMMYYLASHLDNYSLPIQLVGWPVYWFLQGVFMTGIWVIAHECGHQAYSDSKFINNAVGLVLHSALLVPYHSWRISHAKHHASTGHVHEDQVFVPIRRSEFEKENPVKEALETSPIVAILQVFRMLIFGWPAYLIMNASGQPYKKYTSHFHTTSPIFKPTQARQILLSDFGLLVAFSIIYYFVQITSFWTVAKYYLIPYLNVNAWLVMITFLQHTDVYIPHYDPKSWNFVRGALTTVDRDFGWFLNFSLHHINDTHVAHHIFSQMPHYNAEEATVHLKKKLGQYYLYDSTPFPIATYNSITKCMFLEDDGEVLFYKDK